VKTFAYPHPVAPLAQTWHPLLIAKDRSLSNKPKSSLQNGVSRARAGWLAGPEFSGCRFQNITATAAYSRQVAPGQASIPIVSGAN